MKHLLFLLFFSPLLHFNSRAQDMAVDITYTTVVLPNDNAFIYYSNKQPLQIKDFEGVPVNVGGEVVAITSSGFAFKAGFKSAAGKSTLTIQVYCSFDKNKSWMNEKGKNEYILKHEQQHFNISYIGALQFIKKARQASYSKENFSKQIQKLYYDVAADMENLQNKYDAETSNGRNTEKQAHWENLLAAEIITLQQDVANKN
jgi:hypothetical protein